MQGIQFCDHCGAANPDNAQTCWSCHLSLAISGLLHGRYKILKQLGKGGYGAVHLAEDTRMNNKRVAIKEAADKNDISQEILFLSRLDHPNIPPVTDTFEENGKWYLVMKYIEASDLEKIATQTPLTFEEVIEIGLTLCDILSYLHRQHPPIIFRDLKPGNILRDAQNTLYLIDFGIARNYTVGKNKDTMAMGSPGYAPPEQYNKSQTDARSDIYSLASTLYYLFTGDDAADHPFVFDFSLLEQVKKTDWSAFQTMLAMDMKKRPTSMQDVKRILEQLKQGVQSKASSLITHYQPGQTTPDGKHILLLFSQKDEALADNLEIHFAPLLNKYKDGNGKRMLSLWKNKEEMAAGSRILKWWEDEAIKKAWVIAYICSPNWEGASQKINNGMTTLFDFFEESILPTARHLRIPVVPIMGKPITDDTILHGLQQIPFQGTLATLKNEEGYVAVAKDMAKLAQSIFGY